MDHLVSRTVLVSIFSLFANPAMADDLACFDFTMPATPDRDPTPDFANKKTWCYLTRADGDGSRILVFRADKILPELAVLSVYDKAGKFVSMTHGSALKGRTTLHQIDSQDIYPLPVPMTQDVATQLGYKKHTKLPDSALEKASQLFVELADYKSSLVTTRIEEGTFESYLPSEHLPFGGYWWPYSSLTLSAGAYSPLGKYDRMVQARTGRNPGAAAWESANHSLTNVSWGGHCNGWAASAVLHEELTSPKWDPMAKVVVTNSDINGMLAEASFCVQWAFYGRRYYSASDDARDIHADRFHKVLLYYIENLKKPVAMDYYADASVDNHVITGYRFTITKAPEVTNTYNVRADLRVHGYDSGISQGIGHASSYTKTYQYQLVTNEAGDILSGTWTGSNPDFLWVPLAQDRCGRENPNIDHAYILDWMANLPNATSKSLPLDQMIARDLEPGEELPLVVGLKGSNFQVHVGTVTADPSVVVSYESYPHHPTRSTPTPVTASVTLADYSNRTLRVDGQELVRLTIRNNSDTAQNVSAYISHIVYLGGE